MKKSKTTIIFTGALILALFSLGLFVFAIKIVRDMNKNISANYNLLEDKIEQQNKSDLIKKNENYIRESSQRITSYFVDPENIDVFIEDIENIGSEEGVELVVKNVEISKTNNKIISVSFSIKGSFSDVFKTAQMIEYAPYKIHMKSFYISKTIISEQDKLNAEKAKSIAPWQADVVINVISAT